MSRPFLGLIVRVTLQVPTAIAFTLVPTSLQYLDDDDRTLSRAIAPLGMVTFAIAAMFAGDLARLSNIVGFAEISAMLGLVVTLEEIINTGSGCE